MFQLKVFDFDFFLTHFADPMAASICFSITKGDKEVIAFSGFYLMTMNLVFFLLQTRSMAW